MITDKIFYHFDQNRRIYDKNGVKSNAPFYEEHFVKINIIDENEKEYICEGKRTINKRSMLYKISNTVRKKIYTQKEMEDDIFINTKSYPLSQLVRRLPADVLRKVEDLLIRNKIINE